MPKNNVDVKAVYVSSESARTAPEFQYVAGQQYSEPERVTFKVSGHASFTVEMTNRRRQAIQASGGIQGVKVGKNRVTFIEDYSGNAIQAFTVSLKRARTPPPPRQPSYPIPIVAYYQYSQYSHPSDSNRYMGVYKATFEVKAGDVRYTFTRLVGERRLGDLGRYRNMPGELDSDGYGTFTLRGRPAETFRVELRAHDY